MKRFVFLCLTFFLSLTLLAQDKPVKIVFDVTSGDQDVHSTAIRHVKAMSEAYPQSQFEVVMYGGSVDMALKDKSSVKGAVWELAKKGNVTFVVCEGTLKRHNIDASALIDGVKTVPDGIVEIYNKQQEGWGYIKEVK
ncbi:DsrE family protein [Gaetbulibacter aestuarii]|uniref:DsrE family protein n=1 Tax=Gaetbulibacter aestuarii TaxID=1502358 RepID=A0ABW7N431_9FLAO